MNDTNTRHTESHNCHLGSSTARRQRLEALDGWVWDADVAAWEEGFIRLTAYLQAEGHARVPASYSTADGYRLGQWVARQRRELEGA
jgi:hypothetical protein